MFISHSNPRNKFSKRVISKWRTVSSVCQELFRLLVTLFFARKAKNIVIDPWHGELGYELLYWVPFIRQILKRGNYNSITIKSRKATKAIYQELLGHLCKTLNFDFEFSFEGPLKQIEPTATKVYQDDTLYINASIFYVLIRLVRAGYFRVNWIFFLFHFTVRVRRSAGRSVVVWVYKNDCLDANLGNVVASVERIIETLDSELDITIAYGGEDKAHNDYDIAKKISLNPNTNVRVLRYDKSHNGKGFDKLIDKILGSDILICTEGGGCYVGYYACGQIISLSNKTVRHFKHHRIFESKFEAENQINRRRIVV